MSTQPITQPAVVPGNSQYTMLVDSTRRFIEMPTAAAARLVPGSYRNAWAGKRVRGTITPITQGITVSLLMCVDPDVTTNAFWGVDTTADGSGVYVIAAGVTKVIDWAPRSANFAVEALAGATGPADIDISLFLDDNIGPTV